MSISNSTRSFLETQGYVGIDERTLSAVAPWVRWSPSICTSIIVFGTALASPWVLWALVPFALAGALMARHPFDYIYNLGVRRLSGTPPLPEHGAPRRFACGMAAAWVAATGVAFAGGARQRDMPSAAYYRPSARWSASRTSASPPPSTVSSSASPWPASRGLLSSRRRPREH